MPLTLTVYRFGSVTISLKLDTPYRLPLEGGLDGIPAQNPFLHRDEGQLFGEIDLDLVYVLQFEKRRTDRLGASGSSRHACYTDLVLLCLGADRYRCQQHERHREAE